MYYRRLFVMAILLVLLVPLTVQGQDDEVPTTIGLELVAEGFTAPVDLDSPPDETGRLFVTDQIGVIYIITADGERLETPFLDIRDRVVELGERYDERGLLGLAFHPDFASNGRFFVYYSAPLQDGGPAEWNHTTHVSEFSAEGDVADPASERILLMVDEPQGNHNGGDISFGPDGYMYIPLGDGGRANDEAVGHTEGIGNAQDRTNLLGNILRIDVDNGDPYGIPDDNPFAEDENVLPEIWAWGFRNPWRATWDEETGRYFVADAGQNVWEEVSLVEGGQNYGWRVWEGAHCFSAAHPDHNPLNCDHEDGDGNAYQMPIIEYSHQVGAVVVGGYVYRGSALDQGYNGMYFFADWSKGFGTPDGTLFAALAPPEDAEPSMWDVYELTVTNNENGRLNAYVLAFGEDASGELYVLTSQDTGTVSNSGQVWKLVPPAE